MELWWEILSVFLLSTGKFVFGGVPMALGFKFSFIESVIVCSAGGITGVVSFVTLSEKILNFFYKRKLLKRTNGNENLDKKKFTVRNKTIVRVKRKFGLIGFSVMVPFLIPIPLGCFLAVRYFNNKGKIITYLSGSIIFWAVAVSSLHFVFHIG